MPTVGTEERPPGKDGRAAGPYPPSRCRCLRWHDCHWELKHQKKLEPLRRQEADQRQKPSSLEVTLFRFQAKKEPQFIGQGDLLGCLSSRSQTSHLISELGTMRIYRKHFGFQKCNWLVDNEFVRICCAVFCFRLWQLTVGPCTQGQSGVVSAWRKYGPAQRRRTSTDTSIANHLVISAHPLQLLMRTNWGENHHVTGRLKKFYEPINVVLIYSNVEVGRVQRLDFESLSRSIAFLNSKAFSSMTWTEMNNDS